MRLGLVAAVAAVAVAGACATGGRSAPVTTQSGGSQAASPAETAGAARTTAACGGTALRKGDPPAWTRDASPPTLRFAVSDQGNAAGFLFADPLRAGERSDGMNNKILWVVRAPRHGSALHVTARPRGAESPTVHYEFPANSWPGEIYPSIVDVPAAGCWHFVLTWNDNRATIDLQYASSS